MSTDIGRDPYIGTDAGRHAFTDGATFTGASLPAPHMSDTALLLAAPPAGAPVGAAFYPDLDAPAAPAPTQSVPAHAAPDHQALHVPHPHLPHGRRHVRPEVKHGVAARGRSTRRGDIAVTIGGIGLGISIGIGVYQVKGGLDLPGGKMLALGTITALVGTYLALMLILVVARVPWLEREVGHDRMIKLHRTLAPYSLFLILAHVIFTTISYAQAEEHTLVGQLWSLITKSAWMMPATAAFVLMMSLGVMSYRRIRDKMRYETWWVAHLYFYIAIAL